MGIEYIADSMSGQVNSELRANRSAACDFDVTSVAMTANGGHSGAVRTVPNVRTVRQT
jgi:hypothetical protein